MNRPHPTRTGSRLTGVLRLAAAVPVWVSLFAAATRAATFSDVEPIFQQHCVECHGTKDPDGGLVLDSHAGILAGGESGPAFVARKSSESLLVRAIEGNWGKTGKNQFMPPGKRDHLKPEQMAQIRAWIDAGAPAPITASIRELVVPKIEPKGTPRRPVTAIAADRTLGHLAVARLNAVELIEGGSRRVVREFAGHRGPVNALAFSADGSLLFAGGGEPGLAGEIRQWDVRSGKLVKTLQGHRDAIYSLAVAADGSRLISGGYDFAIQLWSLADGTPQRSVQASQGAIYGLDLRPDAKLFASASLDRTAKLFNAAGERLETFGQALKELNTLAFSPDGKMLVTGGNDNRLRWYRIGDDGREGGNSLAATVFAHEGAILKVAFSPDGKRLASAADDRSVKIFSTQGGFAEMLSLEKQPDWPGAIAFYDDQSLAVGRLDGSLAWYSTSDGRIAAPPKPELTGFNRRGVQAGVETTILPQGKNLGGVTEVVSHHPKVSARLISPNLGVPQIVVNPAPDIPRGSVELSIKSPGGESTRASIWIDDLPQVDRGDSTVIQGTGQSIWAALHPAGQVHEYPVRAKAGETLVFDLHAKAIGSKGDFAMALIDPAGHPVAEVDNFEGLDDPFLSHTFNSAGDYKLRVSESNFRGSPDHYYRLSAGNLPVALGTFPLSVAPGTTSQIHLLGAHLDGHNVVSAGPADSGMMDLKLPLPVRTRRTLQAEVVAGHHQKENEPNDSPTAAQAVTLPAVIHGRFDSKSSDDPDVFRFSAESNRVYMIETAAARRGSPVDTRVEVLHPDGSPVARIQLRALRNSTILFRPEDANETGIRFENWEEMELNEYLYANGEIFKLFRAPQGPDSDTLLYSSNGKRRPYFDTTAVGHPVDEPCYIVEPRKLGESFPHNGLPVFTITYVNDDDSLREWGTDSRLQFTAPATGPYLVRIRDARNEVGPGNVYQLAIRPAEPDFSVTLENPPTQVARDSGQSFSVKARRLDGFEGAIEVQIMHPPSGWKISNPLVIEAGHVAATGTLFHSATDSPSTNEMDWSGVTLLAKARVGDHLHVQQVNSLKRPEITAPPKLRVRLGPTMSDLAARQAAGRTNAASEVEIRPGSTAKARLSIDRNGFDGVVLFSVLNLPHGVIVENLGLNGITFLAGENERELSLAAANWVQPQTRWIHAEESNAGKQTSPPLVLKVVK